MIIAETLWELNRNIGHWLFEAEGAIIELAMGALIARVWIRIHDRRHHNHDCKEDSHGVQ